MVMAEMEKPRDTFVLGRGDYRNQGEKVSPACRPCCRPCPTDAPLNRLTLAKWLVDPSHPLTSRVAVNRFWQMYFGVGLVKTPGGLRRRRASRRRTRSCSTGSRPNSSGPGGMSVRCSG